MKDRSLESETRDKIKIMYDRFKLDGVVIDVDQQIDDELTAAGMQARAEEYEKMTDEQVKQETEKYEQMKEEAMSEKDK